MLQHVSLAPAISPFFRVLQTAADRAFTKACPARAYHQGFSPSHSCLAICPKASVRRPQNSSPSNSEDVKLSHPLFPRRNGDESSTVRPILPVSKLPSHRKDTCRPGPSRSSSISPHIMSTRPVRDQPPVNPPVTKDLLRSAEMLGKPLPPKNDTLWPEISASLSSETEAIATHFSSSVHPQAHQLDMPLPNTVRSLRQNLTNLMRSRHPPSLRTMIHYHAQFQSLHSAHSFNILITLSIRLASFGTAHGLFQAMASQGIVGNVETRRLRARLLIRQGDWNTAWQEDVASGDLVPLPVWLEFFGSQKRGAVCRKTCDAGFVTGRTPRIAQARARRPEDRDDDADWLTQATRLRLLLQRLPTVTPDQWTPTPPSVVHAFVSVLLRRGQHLAARDIVVDYLKRLPLTLSARWRHQCLEIVHLCLAARRGEGAREFFHAYTMLGEMLESHQRLCPTSTTLFLLLRPLKGAVKCGSIAHKTMISFQSRWGTRVIDDRVRRRVASLATKEGRMDVAQSVLTAQGYVEQYRQAWKVEHEARGERVGKGRTGSPRGGVFAKRNVERTKWKLLRRRIRRRNEKEGRSRTM